MIPRLLFSRACASPESVEICPHLATRLLRPPQYRFYKSHRNRVQEPMQAVWPTGSYCTA